MSFGSELNIRQAYSKTKRFFSSLNYIYGMNYDIIIAHRNENSFRERNLNEILKYYTENSQLQQATKKIVLCGLFRVCLVYSASHKEKRLLSDYRGYQPYFD